MSDETDIAERMFADFTRGGFEAITWGIHPEVELFAFAEWPGASVYHGREGWAELAAEWTENFDEYGFEVDSASAIEGGALVLATQRARIRSEDDWVSMQISSLWQDFEDGRARVIRWFSSWDEGRAAAGLSE